MVDFQHLNPQEGSAGLPESRASPDSGKGGDVGVVCGSLQRRFSSHSSYPGLFMWYE